MTYLRSKQHIGNALLTVLTVTFEAAFLKLHIEHWEANVSKSVDYLSDACVTQPKCIKFLFVETENIL